MLALAKLCSASYLESNTDAVLALGMQPVAQLGGCQCVVTVASWGGYIVVAFQGTRVTDDTSVAELFDDIDDTATVLPGGYRVASGFWEPLADLWPRIAAVMPPDMQPLITGHSLGGVRAHLAKWLCPSAEVVSFGAPCGADNAFWLAAYPDDPPLRIVNERDFAPAWPWDGTWGQPCALAWMRGGYMTMVLTRPGLDLSVADHCVDGGYIAGIEAVIRLPTTEMA